MPQIRDERVQDAEAVNELLVRAFGREAEKRLVERLRASGRAAIALVVEENDRVLGHIVFSPIAVGTGSAETAVLALAPLAVLPAFQRLGIGSALLSAGLQRCREAGHARVLVLGDPAYYGRFGFVPAARFGVRCPFPAPDGAFMALELQPAAFANTAGLARYGHEFDDPE